MKTEKNILVAFILNISFSLFELIGGIFTNSVSIISDSFHDFSVGSHPWETVFSRMNLNSVCSQKILLGIELLFIQNAKPYSVFWYIY